MSILDPTIEKGFKMILSWVAHQIFFPVDQAEGPKVTDT
jgi:hypothetical protein